MLNEAIFNPDVRRNVHSGVQEPAKQQQINQNINLNQQVHHVVEPNSRNAYLRTTSAPLPVQMDRTGSLDTAHKQDQALASAKLMGAREAFEIRGPKHAHSLPLDALTPIDPLGALNGERSEKASLHFDLILRLMDRSAVIYEEDCDLIQRRFPNTRTITTLSDKGLKYMLEEDPKAGNQTLTIRGTDNLQNSLQDFEYAFTYNKELGIYAHKGFSDDAKAIFNQLLSDNMISRSKPIAITGHSLGGAIANLLLCYFHKNGYHVLPSTTFGQPKVTNAKGLEQYKEVNLTRVVYENDIIPFLPPTTLISSFRGPYQHMGSEVILLDDQYYCYLDEHDASRKSVNSFWKNTLHERLSDHAIPRYLKALEDKQLHPQEVPYEKRNDHIHHWQRLRQVLPCCKC